MVKKNSIDNIGIFIKKIPTKNIDSKLFFSEVIDVQNKYMEEALKERAQEKDEIDLPPSYSDYEDESESEKDE